MSYQGRMHDSFWEIMEEVMPDVDWKLRSKACDRLMDTLETYEYEVQRRGLSLLMSKLEVFLMDLQWDEQKTRKY